LAHDSFHQQWHLGGRAHKLRQVELRPPGRGEPRTRVVAIVQTSSGSRCRVFGAVGVVVLIAVNHANG
jgi:hypothetical protein